MCLKSESQYKKVYGALLTCLKIVISSEMSIRSVYGLADLIALSQGHCIKLGKDHANPSN